jgi:hypothetical protein
MTRQARRPPPANRLAAGLVLAFLLTAPGVAAVDSPWGSGKPDTAASAVQAAPQIKACLGAAGCTDVSNFTDVPGQMIKLDVPLPNDAVVAWLQTLQAFVIKGRATGSHALDIQVTTTTPGMAPVRTTYRDCGLYRWGRETIGGTPYLHIEIWYEASS